LKFASLIAGIANTVRFPILSAVSSFLLQQRINPQTFTVSLLPGPRFPHSASAFDHSKESSQTAASRFLQPSLLLSLRTTLALAGVVSLAIKDTHVTQIE
jgi:hypothetical protein